MLESLDYGGWDTSAVRISDAEGYHGYARFGQILKAYHTDSGLPAHDFARQLGTTRAHLLRLERGESQPSAEVITRASDLLKMDVVYLLRSAIEGREQDATAFND